MHSRYVTNTRQLSAGARNWKGGSAAPSGDANNKRRRRVISASSSPQDESVRMADKGLLDPRAAL